MICKQTLWSTKISQLYDLIKAYHCLTLCFYYHSFLRSALTSAKSWTPSTRRGWSPLRSSSSQSLSGTDPQKRCSPSSFYFVFIWTFKAKAMDYTCYLCTLDCRMFSTKYLNIGWIYAVMPYCRPTTKSKQQRFSTTSTRCFKDWEWTRCGRSMKKR